jgi:hypothetical protein
MYGGLRKISSISRSYLCLLWRSLPRRKSEVRHFFATFALSISQHHDSEIVLHDEQSPMRFSVFKRSRWLPGTGRCLVPAGTIWYHHQMHHGTRRLWRYQTSEMAPGVWDGTRRFHAIRCFFSSKAFNHIDPAIRTSVYISEWCKPWTYIGSNSRISIYRPTQPWNIHHDPRKYVRWSIGASCLP